MPPAAFVCLVVLELPGKSAPQVFGAPAGVEGAQAEVHRIGAILHGGAQGVHGAGGGEKFQSNSSS